MSWQVIYDVIRIRIFCIANQLFPNITSDIYFHIINEMVYRGKVKKSRKTRKIQKKSKK